MNELNKKLEELLIEYDCFVQEGIIVSESEKAIAFRLAKQLSQFVKDLNTHATMKKFTATHKEDLLK
jgi:hypothetical protein